jgi:hypothetical protein
MRAIATASTGSVLPWPGRLNRSRDVINGGTSTSDSKSATVHLMHLR